MTSLWHLDSICMKIALRGAFFSRLQYGHNQTVAGHNHDNGCLWSTCTAVIILLLGYICMEETWEHISVARWRHQMEAFSSLQTFVMGTTGPLTKANEAELWFFFIDLRLNRRLSEQSRRRWFETLTRSLWRPCNNTDSSVDVKFEWIVPWVVDQFRVGDPEYQRHFSTNNCGDQRANH